VVSRQLGHADIQTTMRYAHHAPELTPGIFDRLAEGDAASSAAQVSG
jgi:integrase